VKPGAVKPGAAKPGAAKPGAAKPGAAKPGAAKPGAAKPGAAKPGAVKPRDVGAATPKGYSSNEKAWVAESTPGGRSVAPPTQRGTRHLGFCYALPAVRRNVASGLSDAG
jgi:translation initiation factor IF-2